MTKTARGRLAALLIGLPLAVVVFELGAPVGLLYYWKLCRFEQLDSEFVEQRGMVRAEIGAAAASEWTGSYGWSNGFEHHTLDLSLTRFTYLASACMGTEELAFGTISGVDGARVRLGVSEHAGEREAYGDGRRRFRFSSELYVVPWGEHRFLIPAELMPEFCSLAKADGWDSMRYADYPRKLPLDVAARRDWVELEGLPEVPQEFRRYLPDE